MNSSPKKDNVLIIQPSRGWRHLDLVELWRYRELLYFFTWRDIKIRYKQTAIGVLWAVLQPFLTMIVFSVFFGKFVQIPSDGIPYPIFVYAGLLPWILFAQSLSRCSESVVSNSNLIQKVYFPRLITPISTAFGALVDFFISFVILVLMMVYYKVAPTSMIILLPFLVLLNFACSIGLGLWLSALDVMYRDVRYVVPFLVPMGMFVTPVIYPASIVPEKYHWILYFNPMAGVVEGFRAALLGYRDIPVLGLMLALCITLIFFISGLYFFRRLERKFADVI